MHRLSHLSAVLILVAAGYGLVGCAGSGVTSSEETSEMTAESDSAGPSGPDLQLLTLTANGLQFENLRRDNSTRLTAAESYLGVRAVSPDERYLAVAYAANDSSKLAVVDLDSRTIEPVHSVSGEAVYSISWAPDGDRLGFGYYKPTGGGGMGRGDILVARMDGSTRSVGCRAAKKMLKWLPNGNLAVRDEDNLYVVAAEGCGTVSSLDIRKMHHITYSPDGRRMAYIFRDLVYDRANAEYVPDSTLYVADARGNNENEVFGDEYRARHLRWSPDGSRLAFDVRSRKDRSRRQIIIYDVEGDRLTYLIPPQAAGSQDEIQPRWSPSGDNLAFTLVDAANRHAAVQVMGQTRTLGSADGPVWGWAEKERVVFSGRDSTRVVNLEGANIHAFSNDRELLYIWPASASSADETESDLESS